MKHGPADNDDDGLESVRALIRDVPDFPSKGIIFKDLTPLLGSHAATALVIDALVAGMPPCDVVVGIEARGFLLGTPVAQRLGVGFVPVRKPGKLPAAVFRSEYQLEYGSDVLEMHTDAIVAGQRVLIVDDVLATGGTAVAACSLVESAGGVVAGVSVLVELAFLDGRARLGAYPLHSVLTYQQ